MYQNKPSSFKYMIVIGIDLFNYQPVKLYGAMYINFDIVVTLLY